MASQLETTGGLERRLTLSVPSADLSRKAQERFRSLARTVRMPGFRPGKVPLKMIEQSYGAQVQAEILGDAVSKAFSDAVEEHKLRVAGQPSIASRRSHWFTTEWRGRRARGRPTTRVYIQLRPLISYPIRRGARDNQASHALRGPPCMSMTRS